MLEWICANDKNVSAVLNGELLGEQCLIQNIDKVMTCRNKAVYAVANRIVEKWIENDHIETKMDAEDCK